MNDWFNGFAFALLLTSLFVLRFRGWQRPGTVALYFVFFAALEMGVSYAVIPPGAIGPGLGRLCIGLSIPVLIAAYLVWRHEKRQGETD